MIIGFAGCAKYKFVTINSFDSFSRDYDFEENDDCCFNEGDSFAIKPLDLYLDDNILKKDSYSKDEITNKIKLMLESRNFNVVDLEDPDKKYVLIYDCKMSKSTKFEIDSLYMPGACYTTSGMIGGEYYSTTTTGPGYYDYYPVIRTYYYKSMNFVVIDPNDSEKIIWRSVALIKNLNDDYAKDIDYLLKGIFNRFGKSSKENVEERIKEKDKEVLWLQGLYS